MVRTRYATSYESYPNLFSTGDVAKELCVSTVRVLQYADDGFLRFRRTQSGMRVYTWDDVEHLKRVLVERAVERRERQGHRA